MPTQRRSLPLPCAMEGFVLSQGLQPQSSIVSCSKTRVTLTIFVLFQRISFCASTSVSIYTSAMVDALEGSRGRSESSPSPMLSSALCVFVCDV